VYETKSAELTRKLATAVSAITAAGASLSGESPSYEHTYIPLNDAQYTVHMLLPAL
jgi:hypothetical protein